MNSKLNRMHPAALAAALLGAALVAGCGGGDQVAKFQPTRVLAFGDETSVIDDSGSPGNGRKYTVNALAVDGVTLDCKANPVWVQYLAAGHGLAFPQCNPAPAVAAPASRIYAAPGARVADIAAQIDQHVAAGGFVATDLAAVLAGANDLLALYSQFPAVGEATLVAQAEAAGTALAEQVNRIANSGGRVVVSTLPDFGLAPFGIKQEALAAGRSVLLTRLSQRFNAKLRVTVINDGRRIGLMFSDEALQNAFRFPAQSGYANVVDAVCDQAKAAQLRDCTTATLVAGGNGTTYLWADQTHLSAGGQSLLGQLALARSVANPF